MCNLTGWSKIRMDYDGLQQDATCIESPQNGDAAAANRKHNIHNNNCLKSNIQCIEIRVQWTVHLAVTPKLVICVMYLTSI